MSTKKKDDEKSSARVAGSTNVSIRVKGGADEEKSESHVAGSTKVSKGGALSKVATEEALVDLESDKVSIQKGSSHPSADSLATLGNSKAATKQAKAVPYFAPNYKCLTKEDIDTLQKSRVPIPDNEAERLFALRASELLDSDRSDPMFDRFTSLCQVPPLAPTHLIDRPYTSPTDNDDWIRPYFLCLPLPSSAFLCQRLFDVPIVLVSLVDERRQWFKSAVGLEAPETHRDHAFCAYTVLPDRCRMPACLPASLPACLSACLPVCLPASLPSCLLANAPMTSFSFRLPPIMQPRRVGGGGRHAGTPYLASLAPT